MSHSRRPTEALVEALADHERLLEVGIGRRTDVAAGLTERGRSVTAMDVTPRDVPDGVEFVQDDVTDPDLEYYGAIDAVYALNLPPELHRPTADLAEQLDAACHFTTLGGEPPTVPVDTTQLPGETLYTVTGRNRDV